MNLLEIFIRELLKEIEFTDFHKIQNDIVNKGLLPFEKLFDGRLRFLVPYVSETEIELKKALEEEGYSVNLEDSTLSYSVETRERGPVEKKIKIGKVLNRNSQKHKNEISKILKSEDKILKSFNMYKEQYSDPIEAISLEYAKVADKEKYLLDTGFTKDFIDNIMDYDFWNSLNLEYNNIGSGYSLLFSRAPIDVLRMSDFKHIQNCHSPRMEGRKAGKYWDCAIEETKSGGAVVFVVKNQDISNVDLNEKEIFTDKARKIKGINPIARIRLRNFIMVDKDNEEVEIAIPEKDVYGIDVGYDKIVEDTFNWCHEKQIENFVDEDGDLIFPDQDEISLAGGFYQDTPASVLLNKFFKVENEYSGYVRLENEDQITFEEQVEQEAQNYFDRISKSFNENIDVNWEIDGEGDDAHVIWSASMFLPFPNDEVIIVGTKGNDAKRLIKAINLGANGVINLNNWSDIHETDNTNGYGWIVKIEDDEGSSGDADRFSEFLNYVSDVSSAYPDIMDSFNSEFMKIEDEQKEEQEAEQD